MGNFNGCYKNFFLPLFHILNLVTFQATIIFRAQIPTKCIDRGYLVYATLYTIGFCTNHLRGLRICICFYLESKYEFFYSLCISNLVIFQVQIAAFKG